MASSKKRAPTGKDIDPTQGGLFPSGWACIGFNQNKTRERKKTAGNRTAGKGKTNCECTTFARYCATSARARRHKNYKEQTDAWDKIR
jgi:hypothetical protein